MKTKGNAAKIGAWTDAENAIISRAYIGMLALECAGAPFNKAQHRREGLATMATARDDKRMRSPGSWEMKCCNISAVLHGAGLLYVNGYKPLGHGQQKALALALAAAFEKHADAGVIESVVASIAADCLRGLNK
jgi:hypothetical protein